MARFNQKERLILALIFGKIKNDLEKAVDIDKLLNKSCVEHSHTNVGDNNESECGKRMLRTFLAEGERSV